MQKLNSHSRRHRPGNTLCVGSTRSGKSYGEVHRVIDAAADRDVAIVGIDPHRNSLVWSSFEHLVARGHESRIILDQLGYFDKVPGFRFLKQSTARNPLRRASENQQTAHEFTDVLCRRGNIASLANSPLKEEWVHKAVMFALEQNRERPGSDLQYAFKVGHPKFNSLVRGCTNDDLRFDFEQIASGTIKRGQYVAAERLIAGVCGSPAFVARCGTALNLESFLDGAGILLVEGSSDGISIDAMQTIMGALVLRVINYVRRRSKSTPRVLLVLDEATNAQLITGHEVRAMAELQKKGLDCHVLVQLLDFPSAKITEGVLSNAVRHEWYYNANQTVIRRALEDLGLRPPKDADGKHVDDASSHMRSPEVGERWVKYRGKTRERVWRERVPELRNPWIFPRLARKRAWQALARIRKRPEFQRPGDNDECGGEIIPSPTPSEPSGGTALSAAQRVRERLKKQREDT
jgi:hypothetical protein